jgi:hypothetical protein
MTKKTKRNKTTKSWDKPRLGSPRFERAIQKQIREYEATNRNGPGDHTFRVPTAKHFQELCWELHHIGNQLKQMDKKLDALLFERAKD